MDTSKAICQVKFYLKQRFQVICLLCAFIFTCITALLPIVFGTRLVYGISTGSVGFRFLGITLIFIGVAFMVHFCISYFVPGLLIKYNKVKSGCCLVVLLLALLAVGIFALVVSGREGGNRSVPERSFNKYDVEYYSNWMQNKVKNNWDNYYKKVVVENKELVCNRIWWPWWANHFNFEPALKSGCCEPPKACNFNYTGPHVWSKQESSGHSENVDCNRWNNDTKTLCFDCESCKAAFLQDVTTQWFSTGLSLVLAAGSALLSLLLLAYSIDLSCESEYKILG